MTQDHQFRALRLEPLDYQRPASAKRTEDNVPPLTR